MNHKKMSPSSEADKSVYEIRNLESDPWRFRLAWLLQRFVLAPGLMFYTRILNHTEFIGLENLEELRGKSFLVCPNHTSSFDIWMAFEVGFKALDHFFSNSHYLCGLGAAERLGPTPVRKFCVHAGVLPVDRTKGLEQYALQDAVRLFLERKKEIACLIYPEGTRSKSSYLARDYKAGVGWIQAMTSVPILPVYQVNYNTLPGIGRKLRVVIDKPMYFEHSEREKNQPSRWFEVTSKVMERLYELEEVYHPRPDGIPKEFSSNIVSENRTQIYPISKNQEVLSDTSKALLVLETGKGMCMADKDAKIPNNWKILGELPKLPDNLPTGVQFCEKLSSSLPCVLSTQIGGDQKELVREVQQSKLLPSVSIVDQTVQELEFELIQLKQMGVDIEKLIVEWRYHPSLESSYSQKAKLLNQMGIQRIILFGFLNPPQNIFDHWSVNKPLMLWLKSSIVSGLIRLGAACSSLPNVKLEAILLSELEQYTRDRLRLDQSLVLLQKQLLTNLPSADLLIGVSASFLEPEYALLLMNHGANFIQLEVFQHFWSNSENKLVLSKFNEVESSWVVDPVYFEMGNQFRVQASESVFILLARRLERIYTQTSKLSLSDEDHSFLLKSSGASSIQELEERAFNQLQERYPDLRVDDPRSRLAICCKFLLLNMSESVKRVPNGMGRASLWLSQIFDQTTYSVDELTREYIHQIQVQSRLLYARCLGLE